MQTYQSFPTIKGPELYDFLSLFLRTLWNQSEFTQGSFLEEAKYFCSVTILHHFIPTTVVLIQGAAGF